MNLFYFIFSVLVSYTIVVLTLDTEGPFYIADCDIIGPMFGYDEPGIFECCNNDYYPDFECATIINGNTEEIRLTTL